MQIRWGCNFKLLQNHKSYFNFRIYKDTSQELLTKIMTGECWGNMLRCSWQTYIVECFHINRISIMLYVLQVHKLYYILSCEHCLRALELLWSFYEEKSQEDLFRNTRYVDINTRTNENPLVMCSLSKRLRSGSQCTFQVNIVHFCISSKKQNCVAYVKHCKIFLADHL